jgi:hypothetical protein
MLFVEKIDKNLNDEIFISECNSKSKSVCFITSELLKYNFFKNDKFRNSFLDEEFISLLLFELFDHYGEYEEGFF